jgi:uncharacterized protein (TIGR02145 family)
MNKFNTLLFLAVFGGIGLWGCDDSSSASSNGPDENATVESSSSSICKDCDDESSSSAKKIESSAEKGVESSDDAETGKSSSSKGKGTSSSSEKSESSSSVKTDDSSSSQKNISSSSVSSSSSIKDGSSSSFDITAPCKYGDVYIEESDGEKKAYICYEDGWKRYVPNSSSSSIARSSSSRGYEPLPSPLGYNLSYGEYEDTRDGTKYATIEITNKYGPDSIPKITFTVFAQNLKYHEKITLGANEQDDDTKVEMYCYNDSVEYCNDWWGGLYQWAEMMALPYECNSKSCADRIDPDHDGFHQGICPNGWHLITEKEMLAVSYATGESGNEHLANSVRSEVSFFIAGGNNQSGMSVIAAGFRKNEKNIVYKDIGEGGYFHYPNESRSGDVKACGAGGVFSDYAYFSTGDQKKYGVSVRCVKNY